MNTQQTMIEEPFTVSVTDGINNDVYAVSAISEDSAIEQAKELFIIHHGISGRIQTDIWEDENG